MFASRLHSYQLTRVNLPCHAVAAGPKLYCRTSLKFFDVSSCPTQARLPSLPSSQAGIALCDVAPYLRPSGRKYRATVLVVACCSPSVHSVR
jgi:hypothetical protein